MVRFTPNGWSVISRQRLTSLRRSSGVGWVSPVKEPSAPALATAALQLGPADPLHAALHDRVFHAEHFGEARLDHLLFPRRSLLRPALANLARAH